MIPARLLAQISCRSEFLHPTGELREWTCRLSGWVSPDSRVADFARSVTTGGRGMQPNDQTLDQDQDRASRRNECLIDDYRTKVQYLIGQFDRMWHRFQLLLVVQTGLAGLFLVLRLKNGLATSHLLQDGLC